VFVHEADDRRACLVSGPVPSDATVARLVQAADAFLEALHTKGDG
jgi:hypothetical protein